MKRISYLFNSGDDIALLIKQFFEKINSVVNQNDTHEPGKPEPPTITGLALYLGFNSLQQFEQYEKRGKYAAALKRARLQIEAEYEKKLHNASAPAAIFALKSMGWNEKPADQAPARSVPKILKVQIIETGPQPASSEKEVIAGIQSTP